MKIASLLLLSTLLLTAAVADAALTLLTVAGDSCCFVFRSDTSVATVALPKRIVGLE